MSATDPACAQIGFGPQNTVWYSYTPSSSGFVQANTFGSDYDTTLWVGTGSAGNFTEVGCNDDTSGGTTGLESKVIWDASASTTYYIMAGTCCGGGTNGGNLELTVDTSAPPFTIDDLTISGGKVTPKTGEAVISGSITCSNGPGSVELDVFVSQRIGRATVQILLVVAAIEVFRRQGVAPTRTQVYTSAMVLLLFAAWLTLVRGGVQLSAIFRKPPEGS